ncbi:MAG: glycosyltransferase [Bacteroidetes bacterium]|jgi:cellulose synthase/poly-beta-1,6-N-acetylglucosamine synthase-like glycosyltransferase|nr:glycosyltransferase [Bacteroidota bacterium]
MTLLHILEVLGVLYLMELAFFSRAARRSRMAHRSAPTPQGYPKVSVVVAAKDEERNLPACLQSLLNLAYPKELLEIVVVNDQSADSTPQIIDEAARESRFVKRVDAVESVSTRGKANALAQGIDRAQGELIFLTDADCVVPPTWISETLKYFDDDTGIVGGVTLISNASQRVYGIQALDWDFLLTVGAGAATIGQPVACLGNNLVFRKKAYEEAGGYRKIKFSITEDFALFKAIAHSHKWKYKFPMDKKNLVETLPVPSLKEVFLQRKRWATGGKDTGLFGIVTLAPGFLFHWALIVSLFYSPAVFLIFFLLKTMVDGAFVSPTLRLYGKIAHLKFIVYFEIYYLLYVAILPFSVYLGRAIIWKGRRY